LVLPRGLENNFMLVGEGVGKSIPMQIRNKELHSSDGIEDLATYIGILPTEYKLLKNNGQNRNKRSRLIYPCNQKEFIL
jgi:hypothetical protein